MTINVREFIREWKRFYEEAPNEADPVQAVFRILSALERRTRDLDDFIRSHGQRLLQLDDHAKRGAALPKIIEENRMRLIAVESAVGLSATVLAERVTLLERIAALESAVQAAAKEADYAAKVVTELAASARSVADTNGHSQGQAHPKWGAPQETLEYWKMRAMNSESREETLRTKTSDALRAVESLVNDEG